jgi:flagellar biosynthesis protein
MSKPDGPLQTAVALAYQSGDSAPKIVAKGRGLIAEQIIARAREHGVFVHESKEMVSLLMQVDLDDRIPPALYRAVAELLAWLYHIESAKLSGDKVSSRLIVPIAPPHSTLDTINGNRRKPGEPA